MNSHSSSLHATQSLLPARLLFPSLTPPLLFFSFLLQVLEVLSALELIILAQADVSAKDWSAHRNSGGVVVLDLETAPLPELACLLLDLARTSQVRAFSSSYQFHLARTLSSFSNASCARESRTLHLSPFFAVLKIPNRLDFLRIIHYCTCCILK